MKKFNIIKKAYNIEHRIFRYFGLGAIYYRGLIAFLYSSKENGGQKICVSHTSNVFRNKILLCIIICITFLYRFQAVIINGIFKGIMEKTYKQYFDFDIDIWIFTVNQFWFLCIQVLLGGLFLIWLIASFLSKSKQEYINQYILNNDLQENKMPLGTGSSRLLFYIVYVYIPIGIMREILMLGFTLYMYIKSKYLILWLKEEIEITRALEDCSFTEILEGLLLFYDKVDISFWIDSVILCVKVLCMWRLYAYIKRYVNNKREVEAL